MMDQVHKEKVKKDHLRSDTWIQKKLHKQKIKNIWLSSMKKF